jgi:hypothetical protein
MSAGKVIENVIIFGGIGAMAYLLLKKNPAVDQKPTQKFFLNGVEIKNKDFDEDLIKLCSKSIGRVEQDGKFKTPSEDLLKKCYGIEELNQVNEPLVDRSVLDLSSAPNDDKDLYLYGFSKHRKMYYTPSGDLRANTCQELDLMMKTRETFFPNDIIRNNYTQLRADVESKFNKFNCRDKIEAVRTRSFADALTETAIKSEESVLGKGFKEQKTYIALGSLVLLTGLYLVLKK